MMTVGEERHAALVERYLSRIANSLEQLVMCLETLKDKDKEKDKENERD